MKLRTITTTIALLALFTTPVISMASTSFDQAKKEAIAEIDKAKAAGFEWSDSRKILKKAEDAVLIDNTNMTKQEQLDIALSIINKKVK